MTISTRTLVEVKLAVPLEPVFAGGGASATCPLIVYLQAGGSTIHPQVSMAAGSDDDSNQHRACLTTLPLSSATACVSVINPAEPPFSIPLNSRQTCTNSTDQGKIADCCAKQETAHRRPMIVRIPTSIKPCKTYGETQHQGSSDRWAGPFNVEPSTVCPVASRIKKTNNATKGPRNRIRVSTVSISPRGAFKDTVETLLD